MRHIHLIALLALGTLAGAQLKPPTSQSDDAKKFHPKQVVCTSVSVRLDAYEKRKKLESDSIFGNLKWRSVGPEEQGGRVIWFGTPEKQPQTYYVAFATGGLWRSTDRGNNWTPIFDNEAAYAIGHVALSKDGQTIWIGTGENNSQRTSYDGMGVYKSTDAGATWKYTGLAETRRIGKVVIDPKNENTVYVGAIGGLYSQSTDRGVYKTTDGGKSWQHVLKLDEYTGVIDLAIDPRNPEILFAAAWDRDRRSWNFRDGGPGTAIYKSSNGGKSWTKMANGLPASGNLGRVGLAVAPSKPSRIYAYIDNQGGDPDTLFRDEFVTDGTLTAKRFRMIKDPKVFAAIDKKVLERFATSSLPKETKLDDLLKSVEEGKTSLDDIGKLMEQRNPKVWEMEVMHSEVYRSDDSGASWKKVNLGYLDTEGYGYYCGRVIVSPHDPDDVTISSMLQWRSRDGGKTWKTATGRGVHVDYHWYWYDPTDAKHQMVGNDGGIYVSGDDGGTWRHINSMPVGQFTTIGVDTKSPYNIIGGMQDNGTSRGPSNYRPGRDQLHRWQGIGGGDGSAVAVDPRDDGDLVYGSSQFGSFYARNTKTNESRSIRPRNETPTVPLRFNWISPIIISPHHPDIIYIGSQKLHRSLNQGRTWETLSPDLTKNRENGDVPFSTIKEIAESPFKFGIIYIGCDDGNMRMTMDHGTNWQNIDTPAPDKWVTRIVASKHDRSTVFVSQNGYREDDSTPYLWKSTDFGKSWKSIAGNLPAEAINVVREDPDKKDWLYVGTDMGVYVSLDGGTNWVPLQGGIPRTPVHDLVIQPKEREIVIASHARSVWIFKLADFDKVLERKDKDLFVWPISDTTRTSWEMRRKPDWDTSEPTSPELAGEAFTKEAGKATVKILDKAGKVVLSKDFDWIKGYNTFSIPLETGKGKPRFSTDVKGRKVETGADAVKDPYAAERFQYLPAGEYKVEVTIAGRTTSVNWKLVS